MPIWSGSPAAKDLVKLESHDVQARRFRVSALTRVRGHKLVGMPDETT